MEAFEIKDAESSAVISFEGRIPRGLTGYDGCQFLARFSSNPVTAMVRVYDIRPDKWGDFFLEMAHDWRGWSGVKDHGSLEGHLSLEATSDSLGHIRLVIRLCGVEVGSNWTAESSIVLEAGQLESLASRAKAYFG